MNCWKAFCIQARSPDSFPLKGQFAMNEHRWRKFFLWSYWNFHYWHFPPGKAHWKDTSLQPQLWGWCSFSHFLHTYIILKSGWGPTETLRSSCLSSCSPSRGLGLIPLLFQSLFWNKISLRDKRNLWIYFLSGPAIAFIHLNTKWWKATVNHLWTELIFCSTLSQMEDTLAELRGLLFSSAAQQSRVNMLRLESQTLLSKSPSTTAPCNYVTHSNCPDLFQYQQTITATQQGGKYSTWEQKLHRENVIKLI